MKYSIDKNCYSFRADGVYSNYFNRRLSGHKTVDNYLLLDLKCEDGKIHSMYYHIVMWEHFYGEIPQGLQINHKDENRQNNHIDNLELLTPQGNINYGNRNLLMSLSRNGVYKKTVYQYTLEGELIATYPSTREASRVTSFPQPNIAKACRGLFKTYKNFRWSY